MESIDSRRLSGRSDGSTSQVWEILRSLRKASAFSTDSVFIPATRIPFGFRVSALLRVSGISWMQGPHQVAQKSRKYGFPVFDKIS